MNCPSKTLSTTLLALSAVAILSASAHSRIRRGPPVYGYTVVNTYPHDPNAFTQGLVFDSNSLYEGTGRYGQSTLRKVQLETGRTLQLHKLGPQFFGEGITVYQNKIIQLTWRSGTGFVYDKETFALLRTFNLAGRGWGITHDRKRLIISDGTATIRFLHPESFLPAGQIMVYDNNGPVKRINELEYCQGRIYANVLGTDRIAIIDPKTGRVTAWIDLTGLLSRRGITDRARVLNGIAYDSEKKRLFVTGKLWPKLFEIELTAP